MGYLSQDMHSTYWVPDQGLGLSTGMAFHESTAPKIQGAWVTGVSGKLSVGFVDVSFCQLCT